MKPTSRQNDGALHPLQVPDLVVGHPGDPGELVLEVGHQGLAISGMKRPRADIRW